MQHAQRGDRAATLRIFISNTSLANTNITLLLNTCLSAPDTGGPGTVGVPGLMTPKIPKWLVWHINKNKETQHWRIQGGGATGPNSGLWGPKCGLAPLSETKFPYVNLVSLYHVGIGRFWPSLCKRLDPPVKHRAIWNERFTESFDVAHSFLVLKNPCKML